MQEAFQRQLMRAPRERGNRCVDTVVVQGLGRACRSAGELWRVEVGNGQSVTTHGHDFADATADSTSTSMPPGVSSASKSDIACVDTSTSRYTMLIYAYPSGKSSRHSTIAPVMRQEFYKASAFIDAESRAVDASARKRVKVACNSSGEPIVRAVALPTSASNDSFSSIVGDLRAKGYGTSTSGRDRYLVFYDDAVGSGIAGTGHVYYSDKASTSNWNNSGGMFAVQYSISGRGPNWKTLLHELAHNMGAVQRTVRDSSNNIVSLGSPNSSGGGHCNDGLDVMCYSDGGPTSKYVTSACSTIKFDCGKNDYFHPNPPSGSYLAGRWNVAHPNNLYLEHTTAAPAADTTSPTQPGSLRTTTLGATSATLAWNAASDNVGVTTYRVFRLDSGSWTAIANVTGRSYTVTGLTASTEYSFAVAARDAAGNQSSRATLTTTTAAFDDVTKPEAPATVSVTPRITIVQLSWAPATDDVGVTRYELQRWTGSSWRTIAWPTGTSATVRGLRPLTTYYFRVRARDAAGNRSDFRAFAARTRRDTVRPTRTSRPAGRGTTRTSARVVWSAARDNVAVRAYRIYRWNGSRWAVVGSTPASRRAFANGGLRPGRAYYYRVRAVDTAGNLSAWSPARRMVTRR